MGRHEIACVAGLLIAVLGCRSHDAKPKPKPEPEPEPEPAARVAANGSADARIPKPPDEMDERMRHCPLAFNGASATVQDIDGGVRFVVEVPVAVLEDARQRARHLVDFAARRTREGHGEFDGKGGGHMKNCPIVTDDVAIAASDVEGGVQLDVTSTSGAVDALRAESRQRAAKFPFAGATVRLLAR